MLAKLRKEFFSEEIILENRTITSILVEIKNNQMASVYRKRQLRFAICTYKQRYYKRIKTRNH